MAIQQAPSPTPTQPGTIGSSSAGGTGVKLSFEALLGSLNDTMGGLKSGIDWIHAFMTQNPRQSPIVRPLQGAVVSDGSTYVFIDMGGPTYGRVWDVRRLAIFKGAVDPFATVSGVSVIAVVMAGGALPQRGVALANLPPIQDLAFGPGQVPNDGDFSAHEFTIKPGFRLVLMLKGTSNNDNYLGTGQAEEYLESSFEVVVA